MGNYQQAGQVVYFKKLKMDSVYRELCLKAVQTGDSTLLAV